MYKLIQVIDNPQLLFATSGFSSWVSVITSKHNDTSGVKLFQTKDGRSSIIGLKIVAFFESDETIRCPQFATLIIDRGDYRFIVGESENAIPVPDVFYLVVSRDGCDSRDFIPIKSNHAIALCSEVFNFNFTVETCSDEEMIKMSDFCLICRITGDDVQTILSLGDFATWLSVALEDSVIARGRIAHQVIVDNLDIQEILISFPYKESLRPGIVEKLTSESGSLCFMKPDGGTDRFIVNGEGEKVLHVPDIFLLNFMATGGNIVMQFPINFFHSLDIFTSHVGVDFLFYYKDLKKAS